MADWLGWKVYLCSLKLSLFVLSVTSQGLVFLKERASGANLDWCLSWTPLGMSGWPNVAVWDCLDERPALYARSVWPAANTVHYTLPLMVFSFPETWAWIYCSRVFPLTYCDCCSTQATQCFTVLFIDKGSHSQGGFELKHFVKGWSKTENIRFIWYLIKNLQQVVIDWMAFYSTHVFTVQVNAVTFCF